MSEQRHQDDQQQPAERLWRRYLERAGDAGTGPGLDANALAAYLDGTAAEEVAEQVEAAMASDPDLLAEVMELRALAAVEPATPPEALLAKLKALAPGGQARPGPTRSGSLVLQGFWRRARWAAAAAAIVLACASGYGLGRETFHDSLQAEAAAKAAPALDELISEPDLAGPQANGPNGGES